MLPDADSEISHTIDGAHRYPAEVTRTRESDMNEFVEEIEHAGAAEGHLIADDIADARLKRGDWGACGAGHRSLSRYLRETIGNALAAVLFIFHGTGASGNDNLLYAPRGHRPLVAERSRKCVERRLLFLFGEHHGKLLRKLRAALSREPDQAPILNAAPDAGRLFRRGVNQHDVRRVDGRGTLYDATRLSLTLLRVALRKRNAIDDNASLSRQNAKHLTLLPLILAGGHDDLVSIFYFHFHIRYQTPSGASPVIFPHPRSTSSRGTGPKMRLPLGPISFT